MSTTGDLLSILMPTSSERGPDVNRKRTMLTATEVADYLRVHVMTVYRLVQRGDLPAIRVGKRWRFRRDHVDQWLLREGTVKPATSQTRSRR